MCATCVCQQLLGWGFNSSYQVAMDAPSWCGVRKLSLRPSDGAAKHCNNTSHLAAAALTQLARNRSGPLASARPLAAGLHTNQCYAWNFSHAVTFRGERKVLTPEEISAAVLGKMRDTAAARLGDEVKQVTCWCCRVRFVVGSCGAGQDARQCGRAPGRRK